MNNFLSTFQDREGLETRQFTSANFEEKPCNTAYSINSKINKHIFFQNPNSTKNIGASIILEKATSLTHLASQHENISENTLKNLTEFITFLLEKFKIESDFIFSNANRIAKLQQEDSTPVPPELNKIKNLLNFDSFTLHYKKENSSFYKIDAIVNRFQTMVKTLEEILVILRDQSEQHIAPFQDEEECQKSLREFFPKNLFENEYFLKTCSEFYRWMRNGKTKGESEFSLEFYFDNMKLFLYAISFPTPSSEDYPLHRAVFSSNMTLIRRICAREKSPVFHANIEQSDPAGVTPLMLAVLMGNKDVALILTNHGANPKHRSYLYARTPIEEAIFRKNRSMIKTLLQATMARKEEQWERNRGYLIDFLQKVPDFSFEMNWECDSKIIPFVKKIAPSDTYKVYKRGSSIRIDLSLLKWSKMKSVRGNSSIIFNGTNFEGRLLMIDHTKKNAVDILGSPNNQLLENKVDELIKHEQTNSEIKAENVVFKPATTWRGEIAKTNIDGYDCTKCIAKGTFSLLFTQRNVLMEINASQYDTFEKYFNYVKEEPLWILEDSKGEISWGRSPFLKIQFFMDHYHSIIKSLFEKDGKDQPQENKLSARGRKEIEKINISQKKLLKNITKNIVATIYMCENFPLNLDHFFPVLDILSNVSPHINRVKEFLERTLSLSKNSFPIKMIIPIFFSLNANLTMKEFSFKPVDPNLFDIESMIQRRAKPVSNFVFREERNKTEGSDEEHAKNMWQELLKHDDSDEEIVSYSNLMFEYKEDPEEDEDVGEPIETLERNRRLMNSFFKKTIASTINKDLEDVYDDELEKENDFDTEGENLKDLDISEKSRNETFKLSSHQRISTPKTITFLQEKFKSPTNSSRSEITGFGFGEGVKGPMLDLNLALQSRAGVRDHQSTREKATQNSIININYQNQYNESTRSKESFCSRNFNDVDFSENVKESQKKRLMKYTVNHNNLLEKVGGGLYQSKSFKGDSKKNY